MRDAKQFQALLREVMRESEEWLKKLEDEPRPAEKKRLAEKMKDNFPYASNRIMSDANWESTAKVAIEHACEIVDSCNGIGTIEWRYDVRKALRDSL